MRSPQKTFETGSTLLQHVLGYWMTDHVNSGLSGLDNVNDHPVAESGDLAARSWSDPTNDLYNGTKSSVTLLNRRLRRPARRDDHRDTT